MTTLHRSRPTIGRLLRALGPAWIVMLADVDAASVLTAAKAGTDFGYAILLPLVVLIPVLYLVQEMTAWLAIGTGLGHAELIRELAVWLHVRGQDPAAETLYRDWDDFTTFYDFPAEHWLHLRTSNPIESVFAGVRLRTNVAKRARVRENALYLVFKIVEHMATRWRVLNGGPTVMSLVLGGEWFVDGVLVRRPPREEVQAA